MNESEGACQGDKLESLVPEIDIETIKVIFFPNLEVASMIIKDNEAG